MQLFIQQREAASENWCVAELIESQRALALQTLVEQHAHHK